MPGQTLRPQPTSASVAGEVDEPPVRGTDRTPRPFRNDQGLPRTYLLGLAIQGDVTLAFNRDQEHVDLGVDMLGDAGVRPNRKQVEIEVVGLL